MEKPAAMEKINFALLKLPHRNFFNAFRGMYSSKEESCQILDFVPANLRTHQYHLFLLESIHLLFFLQQAVYFFAVAELHSSTTS